MHIPSPDWSRCGAIRVFLCLDQENNGNSAKNSVRSRCFPSRRTAGGLGFPRRTRCRWLIISYKNSKNSKTTGTILPRPPVCGSCECAEALGTQPVTDQPSRADQAKSVRVHDGVFRRGGCFNPYARRSIRRRLTNPNGVGLSFQASGLSLLHAVELPGCGRIAALTASLRA
jgi:hypothetical protein